MLNRSASLAMSTSVLKALPGKLDIKRHLPSILYYFNGYLLFIAAKAASLCSNVSQLLWRSSGFPENRNKIYLVKATQEYILRYKTEIIVRHIYESLH